MSAPATSAPATPVPAAPPSAPPTPSTTFSVAMADPDPRVLMFRGERRHRHLDAVHRRTLAHIAFLPGIQHIDGGACRIRAQPAAFVSQVHSARHLVRNNHLEREASAA